jgi:nickel-dependent lactate racemase
MQIKLPYGKDEIILDVPEKNLLGILTPKPPTKRVEIDIKELQENLKRFLANSKSVLVVVNDYTRPTPTEMIVAMIEPIIKDYDFKFIVACGSHRAPMPDEFVQIFGKYYELYKERILVHDAKDNAKVKFLGKTRRNTPVWLNQAIWEADKIIAINSVEPHYFAGFTGGRKSFLPGIAGLETITANHKLSLQPQAKTLALEGNPVNEDMNEIAKMVPRDIFSIQVVIDPAPISHKVEIESKNESSIPQKPENKCGVNDKHQIYSIRCGDIFRSEEQAIEDAKEIFCVPIKEKADIVIALIQEPYDINFYQSQKGMENAKLALRNKGIMITASKCRKGIGDDEFVQAIASCNSPTEVIEKVAKDFKLGRHKSAKLAEIMQWAEIWTVMPISDEVIRSVFMRPFQDINDALQKALEQKGADAKILILPDASLTVPFIREF